MHKQAYRPSLPPQKQLLGRRRKKELIPHQQPNRRRVGLTELSLISTTAAESFYLRDVGTYGCVTWILATFFTQQTLEPDASTARNVTLCGVPSMYGRRSRRESPHFVTSIAPKVRTCWCNFP